MVKELIFDFKGDNTDLINAMKGVVIEFQKMTNTLSNTREKENKSVDKARRKHEGYFESILSEMGRFSQSFLALAFFGGIVKDKMMGLLKPASDLFNISELWSTTLQVLFLPIIETVFPYVINFLTYIMDMGDDTKKKLGAIAIGLLAFGTALASIGAMSLGVSGIITFISKVNGLMTLQSGGAFTKFVTGSGTLAKLLPALLIVAATLGIAYAILRKYPNELDYVKDKGVTAFTEIKNSAMEMGAAFLSIFTDLELGSEGFAQALSNGIGFVIDSIKNIILTITTGLTNLFRVLKLYFKGNKESMNKSGGLLPWFMFLEEGELQSTLLDMDASSKKLLDSMEQQYVDHANKRGEIGKNANGKVEKDTKKTNDNIEKDTKDTLTRTEDNFEFSFGNIAKSITDSISGAVNDSMSELNLLNLELDTTISKNNSLTRSDVSGNKSSNTIENSLRYYNDVLGGKTKDLGRYVPANDFILRPDGTMIKPSPDDTIVGFKGNMPGGANIVQNISVTGSMVDEVKRIIRDANVTLMRDIKRITGA